MRRGPLQLAGCKQVSVEVGALAMPPHQLRHLGRGFQPEPVCPLPALQPRDAGAGAKPASTPAAGRGRGRVPEANNSCRTAPSKVELCWGSKRDAACTQSTPASRIQDDSSRLQRL